MFAEMDQLMAGPEENIIEPQVERMQEESTEYNVKPVQVDKDHPFDLEGYIAQYSGMPF